MADIKQAAKWMQEGKMVTRATHRIYRMEILPRDCPPMAAYIQVHQANKWTNGWALQLGDLLADDWEIAND